MKKRMNVLSPCPDRLDIADFEELTKLEAHVAELKHAAYLFANVELVPAVNAGTEQHLKCSAKSVLVNCGRAVEPDVGIDKKPGRDKDRYRRVAKAAGRVLLPRQLILL